MKGIMVSAMGSGSGKTVLTCAMMRAFQRRGLTVSGFKCGPDYIDPMFHSRVLGGPSRNLDLFLQGPDGVRHTMSRSRGDLAILEGAMGFYDGLAGTTEASAWKIADALDTPVILALRPRGQSVTLAAQIRGLMSFRQPSHIVALILTDCKPSLADHLRPILERETGLPVLGCLPSLPEAELGSRHLGLVTAAEVADLSGRFDILAESLEYNADLDLLFALAADLVHVTRPSDSPSLPCCRIATAMDEAFSFYYQDNLDALAQAGAELQSFSPIRDEALPDADGLYLGGGYPELYMQALSRNESMRRSIRNGISRGLPTVAECGGFLYLQQSIRDEAGKEWPMAGVLPGTAFSTPRLRRFGYLTVQARTDSLLFRAGEEIPAHEFHYWDCSDCGATLSASRRNGQRWQFGYSSKTLYAGFPHLHWGGAIPMAQRFAAAARAYREGRT